MLCQNLRKHFLIKTLYELKANKISIKMKIINVYLYGDSHVRSFFGLEEQILYKDRFLLYNKYKSSVSLSGILKNTNEYRLEILEQIKKDPNGIYIFKFGQVDVEYVYNYKIFVEKKDIDFKNYYFEMLDRYTSWVKSLPVENKFICSTNLPNQNHSIFTILQHLNNYSLNIPFKNVSNNIILFNDMLQQKCQSSNIHFLNILNLMIEKKNDFYVLKDFFVGKDHHIKGGEWQPMLTYERHLNKEYGLSVNYYLQNELYNFLLSANKEAEEEAESRKIQ